MSKKIREEKNDATIEIRVWMLRNNLRIIDAAKATKKSRSAIVHFLKKEFKSPVIAGFFKEKGCPMEFFDGDRVAA